MRHLFLLLTLSFSAFMGAHESKSWKPDCGDGTYINPIVHADYSDPDVVAVDGDYWMTASSFQCTPGLPILHSRDLVNWEIVNHALPRLAPEEFYATPRHGKGVWAPSMRYHNGTYYIYWGDPDHGIFMVETRDPRGQWSEPLLVEPGRGLIDPCPLWDADGRAYLVHAWAGSRAGFNSVLTMREMTPDGRRLVGNPVIVWDGNDGTNHTVEGPKLYRRDGKYFILCPAGGVAQGWQLALRADSPWGPYEARRVLSQGATDINGPHQGALIDTPQGESWFLHFQDKGLWGRVLHLNPVKWTDGWPVMGNNGSPVTRHRKPSTSTPSQPVNPAESDDFPGGRPGLQWQWQANYDPTFGMPITDGRMRLYSHYLDSTANLWSVPNILLQKFPAPGFTATAHVTIGAKEPGNESGLVVMGLDYGRIAVTRSARPDLFTIALVTCRDADQGTSETRSQPVTIKATRTYDAGALPNSELALWLRLHVTPDGLCTLSYSTNGKKYIQIGTPFMARQGKWVGARTGFYSITAPGTQRGWIDLHNFEVTK